MGTEHEAWDGELFPTLVVSCWASVARGEEAGRFREVAGLKLLVGDDGLSAEHPRYGRECLVREFSIQILLMRGSLIAWWLELFSVPVYKGKGKYPLNPRIYRAILYH